MSQRASLTPFPTQSEAPSSIPTLPASVSLTPTPTAPPPSSPAAAAPAIPIAYTATVALGGVLTGIVCFYAAWRLLRRKQTASVLAVNGDGATAEEDSTTRNQSSSSALSGRLAFTFSSRRPPTMAFRASGLNGDCGDIDSNGLRAPLRATE